MEIPNNVDDMLREAMTGQKLDPLPEKAADVPHETSDISSATTASTAPKADLPQEKVVDVPIKPASKPEKPETNEYGDATENGLEKAHSPDSTNEYGLETEAPKTYTKAEMDEYANRLMRERVARFERNNQQQPTQQQQQQAAQQGFQYDENSTQDWQQQLEQFFDQAADRREQRKAEALQVAVQQEEMQQLGTKFQSGMRKFDDYHAVLAGKKVTDAMVMAASDINDPAALFYAAAKRMPDELAKIAEIKSPYAQAAAIGRLDEKLRKASVKVSSAPKPISPTKTDTTTAFQPKQTSGNELDDLLLADKKSRLASISSRRR